jgi:protease-4
MAKFLIGVVIGLLLAGLFLVIGVFALARFGQRPPSIAANSTLILKLEGEIPERPPEEIPLPLFQSVRPATVSEIWSLLQRASGDSRIAAVVLMPQDLTAGWGKLEQIRESLLAFKKSGKPLVAMLRGPGTREYYLATAADRIYMEPEDLLDVKGLRAEAMYFRKTLDKLGVQVEIQRVGKYKDFGDMFTRTSMSPDTKDVLNSVLDVLYGDLLKTIADSRKQSVEQVRTTLDDGPFLPKQALQKGLVDALLYEDEMYARLKQDARLSDIKKLPYRDYMQAAPGDEGKPIALLIGEGDIVRGDGESSFSSDEGVISSGSFTKTIRRVANDSKIHGVIVRIDSPGGDSFASDEIWREMNLLSKKKPLVISMSDTAASGGYYIAMTGDPIVAYPGTVTGSIGVFFGKVVLKGLYDKLGITKDELTRGRYADIDSDYRPLTPAEQKKLQEGIDDDYAAFLSRVAQARKRTSPEIDAIAQGRVWLGAQAKDRGLVDYLGGLDRAVELVKEKAHIGRQEKVRLVVYPPKRSIFERLFSRPSESEWSPDQALSKLIKDAHARVWLKGGVLRMMPYSVSVR